MAGTFVYVNTNEEDDRGSNFIVTKIKNFFESLYWAYYIHLPYYLMKNEEAGIMHGFFLILFTFTIYAIVMYLPSSLWYVFQRAWYYGTGEELTIFKGLL